MEVDHLLSGLKVSMAQQSQAGIKPQNEDCLGIRVPDEPLLTTKGITAVIADGVSAASAGKEASEICVQNFLSDYYSTPDSWTVKTSGWRVLTALNRWLFGLSQKSISAQEQGFVSTMSCLVIKSNQAHIFHVGDSRVYRLRGGDFEQLTSDHTVRIDASTTYLSRAMGIDLNLDVDYRNIDVETGDVFLLTTDGVHDYVTDQAMVAAITKFRTDLDKACESLIAQALENDSHDNVSCQLLGVDEIGLASSEDVFVKLHKLPFPPDLYEGFIIDGYKVVSEIYSSNRSQLYLVEDTETGKRVVMKTPSINYSDDAAYIERFIMEEWIGKRIENPYVIKVITPERQRSFLYYLTEYADGVPLSQWISSQKHTNVSATVQLADKIMRGLRALHRKELLHQDLKPGNIIVRNSGEPVLIDFGSVHAAGIHEIETSLQRDHILGTEDYAAPEYKLGVKATARSDQFSFAMIVYEMLTKEQAYGEKFARAQSVGDFSRLKYMPSFKRNPMVPTWIDETLRKAVQINPDQRYESLTEFVQDLQKPNQKYLAPTAMPLIERDPLKFYQIALGISVLVNFVLFVLLSR